MFIIFLILNEVSCGKVEKTLNLFAATYSLSVFYATRFIFLLKFEQRLSYIARACQEKYTVLENDTNIVTCCRNDKVSALYRMKIHHVFKK